MLRELNIEFKNENEIEMNGTIIKSKPLVTFLRHAFDFLLGPSDEEVAITRDYYDEHVASYIILQGGQETRVYINDTSVEIDGTEIKDELLASLLKHALNAYFLTNGDTEMEIKETKPGTYHIRAKTPGG